MFLGEYQHSLDVKGRVILPAKHRDQLAEGGFVSKGIDGCLCVYTNEEWERVADEVRELSKRGTRERQAARTFFSGAADVTPDKQGRVAIPQPLRDYAGLERDVVVAGLYSRIEIWDAQRWNERNRQGEHALADPDADIMPDFGI